MGTAEQEVRDLVDAWAVAVHEGRLDDVVARHSADIVMFDVPPPEGGVRGLEAYRETPGTMGTVRRADRLLAVQLHQRGLSLKVIENALVLAATRRLLRPSDAPPLSTIRSLAYFLPVIEEVLASDVGPEYFEYLRYKLARIAPPR